MFRVCLLREMRCYARHIPSPASWMFATEFCAWTPRCLIGCQICTRRLPSSVFGGGNGSNEQLSKRRMYHSDSERFLGTTQIPLDQNMNTVFGNTVVLIGSQSEGRGAFGNAISPRVASADLFGKELELCMSHKEILNLIESRKAEMTLANAITAIVTLAQMLDKMNISPQKMHAAIIGRPGFHEICHVIMTNEMNFDAMSKVMKAAALFKLDEHHDLSMYLFNVVKMNLDAKTLNISQICMLCPLVSKLQSNESVILKQALKEIDKQKKSLTLKDVLNVLRALCVSKDVPETLDLLMYLTNYIHKHANALTKSELSRILQCLTLLDYENIACMFTLSKLCAKFATEFTNQELVQVLRALVYFRVMNFDLLRVLEEEMTVRIPELMPETLSRIMQYFGSCRFLALSFFNAVADHFVSNAEKFSSTQLTQLLLPFGKLNYLPTRAGEMFDKIEETFNYRWYEFQAEDILDLVHSFVMIERFPLNYTHKIFSSHFLQKLKGAGGVDFQTKCQLTQTLLALHLECPSYKIPKLPWQYQTRYLNRGFDALETKPKYMFQLKVRIQELLGGEEYVAFWVSTQHLYHIDVQIKLDKDGFVLPAHQEEGVHTLVALCVIELDRYCVNCLHLTGAEAMRQRHLKLLGYRVAELPFYELEQLQSMRDWEKYLHNKIFPTSPMLQW
ncbi:FAST kinase domain-containing protein 3, mitochondrial-like [Ptychodera flava]|uniref:FAST kinase domain-containing protein 3, mitochondrial-like n=1 Tax=Ptychodera flava TaxID=63121 RepID=UPI003969E5C2